MFDEELDQLFMEFDVEQQNQGNSNADDTLPESQVRCIEIQNHSTPTINAIVKTAKTKR